MKCGDGFALIARSSSYLGLGLALMTMALPTLAQSSDFSFDAAEFKKKPLEWAGYIEPKAEALHLRANSAAYPLQYPGQAPRSTLLRNTWTLELSGKANLGDWVLDARAQGSYASDALGSSTKPLAVMEGGLRYSASPGLTFDVGKRVQRWGKGYAMTTVGFIERAKDASDPAASREGFVMASVEATRSFDGPIAALGFTGVLVPTDGSTNSDFGRTTDLNPAAKLYLLAWDTDVDLLWRAAGAKPQAWGMDFSSNLSPSLELHGEWSRQHGAMRTTVDALGLTRTDQVDATAWLLGLRYLTSAEVTWIAEWVHNSAGFNDAEVTNYYRYLYATLVPPVAPSVLAKARALAQSGLGRPNPAQDYAVVKASVSEPWGWVYGTAAATWMVNVQDDSWQFTPELGYTGFNGWDLRARLLWLHGAVWSEFGEKLAERRVELTARYSF